MSSLTPQTDVPPTYPRGRVRGPANKQVWRIKPITLVTGTDGAPPGPETSATEQRSRKRSRRPRLHPGRLRERLAGSENSGFGVHERRGLKLVHHVSVRCKSQTRIVTELSSYVDH